MVEWDLTPGLEIPSHGSNTLLPILTAHARGASFHGEQAIIEGTVASLVRVVGRIAAVRPGSHLEYDLEDCSGSLIASLWTLGDDAHSVCKINTYATAIGSLVLRNNTTIELSALTVRPIECADEITTHTLDALLHHLRRTRRVRLPAPISSAPSSQTDNPVTRAGALPSLYGKVLETCRRLDSERGVEGDIIISALNGTLTAAQVWEALEYLSREGLVFNTHSDTAFRVT
eukprot:m.47008 g.47008  ORF g.47008 m.47008 type:complete len:231 (+) comp11209_c0_seq2:30-722(+)